MYINIHWFYYKTSINKLNRSFTLKTPTFPQRNEHIIKVIKIGIGIVFNTPFKFADYFSTTSKTNPTVHKLRKKTRLLLIPLTSLLMGSLTIVTPLPRNGLVCFLIPLPTADNEWTVRRSHGNATWQWPRGGDGFGNRNGSDNEVISTCRGKGWRGTGGTDSWG